MGNDSPQEICYEVLTNKAHLYHLGIEPIARSALTDEINRKFPAVFKTLFNELLA